MRLYTTDAIAVSLVLIAYAVNGLCTAYNAPWYTTLTLPPFTPSDWIFTFAWQIIYLLIAVALARTLRTLTQEDIGGIVLWILHGVSHIIWSPLFFCGHAIWAGLIDAVAILLTIWLLIWYMWHYDAICSALLIPYGIWMMLAVYLNIGIMMLN